MFGRRKTPEQTPSGPENPSQPSRRKFLKAAGILGAAATVGTLLEIGRESVTQPLEVEEVSQFLRGEPSEHQYLEMFGQKLDRRTLVLLLKDSIDDPQFKEEDVAKLLDSFADMVEVEKDFGRGFNTLPLLEKVDPVAEKVGVSTASSYGYGQINPATALETVKTNQEKPEFLKLMPKSALKVLSQKNPSEHEIVKALKLDGNENIVYSFLHFYKAYNFYGRNRDNILNPDHLQDPRIFGLAVSAYSANFLSPVKARVQTYLNELMLTEAGLKDDIVKDWQQNPKTFANKRLLEVDGDLGPKTLQAVKLASQYMEVPPLPDNFNKFTEEEQADAFGQWLAKARGYWLRGMQSFIAEQKKKVAARETDCNELAQMALGRYRSATTAFLALKKLVPEDQAKDLFRAFVEKRDSAFAEIIASPQAFQKRFPNADYYEFISKVVDNLSRLIRFDERYRGYIPMAYAPPAKILGNPRNVLERVIRAQDMDEKHPARIGLFPSRQERRRKRRSK